MSIDDQFFLKAEKLPEADNITDYTGDFRSKELNIKYHISSRKNTICIEPVKKFSGATLKMIARDIFFSPEEGIKLRFMRDHQGNVTDFFLDSFRSMNYHFSKL
jgi:hypothetical protein